MLKVPAKGHSVVLEIKVKGTSFPSGLCEAEGPRGYGICCMTHLSEEQRVLSGKVYAILMQAHACWAYPGREFGKELKQLSSRRKESREESALYCFFKAAKEELQ